MFPSYMKAEILYEGQCSHPIAAMFPPIDANATGLITH